MPKIPSVIAGQIPAGSAEGTPLPLNATKDAVATPPVPVAYAVSPPVRFAPLGYGEAFCLAGTRDEESEDLHR